MKTKWPLKRRHFLWMQLFHLVCLKERCHGCSRILPQVNSLIFLCFASCTHANRVFFFQIWDFEVWFSACVRRKLDRQVSCQPQGCIKVTPSRPPVLCVWMNARYLPLPSQFWAVFALFSHHCHLLWLLLWKFWGWWRTLSTSTKPAAAQLSYEAMRNFSPAF